MAALLAATLLGCDTVQEAGDSLNQATDKASICVEALRLAGFYPDVANPEQAAKDAQKTAEDLEQLASQTPDEALRQALNDMSDKVGELGPGSIDPARVTSWAAEKADALNALTSACT